MAARTVWYQQEPFRLCKNRRGFGPCGDPRCSLECRRKWGERQAWMVEDRLRQLDDKKIFFGTFEVRGDVSLAEHKQIRTRFCGEIRTLRKTLGVEIEFRGAAEIGPHCDGMTLHHHLCVWSSGELSKATIRQAWANACRREVVVEFDRARYSIKRAAKYIFKAAGDHFVRLFRRGTIPITWGSRGFFGSVGAGKYEEQLIAAWRRSRPATVRRILNDLPPDADAEVVDACKRLWQCGTGDDEVCLSDAVVRPMGVLAALSPSELQSFLFETDEPNPVEMVPLPAGPIAAGGDGFSFSMLNLTG